VQKTAVEVLEEKKIEKENLIFPRNYICGGKARGKIKIALTSTFLR
jgi:hypothetical protein